MLSLGRKPFVELIQIEWVEAERKVEGPVPATSHALSQPAPIQRSVRRTGRAVASASRPAPHVVPEP